MLILPAILESHRSLKDKSLKLVFETSEVTPEQLVGIAQNTQKFGYLAFKEDTFKQDEQDVLDGLKSEYEDKGKSPSQRLRNVLYIYYKQSDKGFKTFTDFYNNEMETILYYFKNKLD